MQRRVLPGEHESGTSMIECARIEHHRCCVTTEVFLVAFDARAGGVQEMQAVPVLRLDTDVPVSRQTLFSADLLANLVALGAILRSVERLMCPR